MKRKGKRGRNGSCLLFFLLKCQDKAAHSCLPSLRHGGSVWQLRMWVLRRARELRWGRKRGCFSTLGGSCATVCGVGATRGSSEVAKLKQNLASVGRPAPERLFLIYGPHQRSEMCDYTPRSPILPSSTLYVGAVFRETPVFNTHHIPAPAVAEQMSSPGLPQPLL